MPTAKKRPARKTPAWFGAYVEAESKRAVAVRKRSSKRAAPVRRRWWEAVDWKILAEMRGAGAKHQWWLVYECGRDDGTIYGPFPTQAAARAAEPTARKVYRKRFRKDAVYTTRIEVVNAPDGWAPNKPEFDRDWNAPATRYYVEKRLMTSAKGRLP